MITRRAFGRYVLAACGASLTKPLVAAPAHGVAQILDEAVSRRLAAGYSAYLGRGGQHRTFVAGVQDLSTRVPMRPDTIFRVASITKPVVAAAAMILVDE